MRGEAGGGGWGVGAGAGAGLSLIYPSIQDILGSDVRSSSKIGTQLHWLEEYSAISPGVTGAEPAGSGAKTLQEFLLDGW